jgi:hypothetical protein
MPGEDDRDALPDLASHGTCRIQPSERQCLALRRSARPLIKSKLLICAPQRASDRGPVLVVT